MKGNLLLTTRRIENTKQIGLFPWKETSNGHVQRLQLKQVARLCKQGSDVSVANSTKRASRFSCLARFVARLPKVIHSGRRTGSLPRNHYILLRPIKPGNVQTDDPHRPEVSGHWNVSLIRKAESDRPEVFGRDKDAV